MCCRFFDCECSVFGPCKRNFFRDSTFATVSFSALLVRSRRSSVSAKSVKTVDFGRLNINKLKAKLSVNSII